MQRKPYSPYSDEAIRMLYLLIVYLLSFVIQWIMFTYSYLNKTEKFYDLTGSATYLILTSLSLYLGPTPFTARKGVLSLMLSVWAIRLGSFLFLRVQTVGSDWRFEKVKTQPKKFFVYWTVQGLWVIIIGSPVWIVSLNKQGDNNGDIGLTEVIGIIIFMFGFLFETIADFEKYSFKQEKQNKDKPITTGIWSLCQYPNYFGEIVLQIGIFITANRSLIGFQKLAILSPIFTYFLLTKVSGIPILERKARKKYANDKEYQEYIKRTPKLIPNFFSKVEKK